MKYLGVQINPWKGILVSPLRETVKYLTDKLSRAPLKPSQNIDMLQTYALPRITYVADHAGVRTSLLKECDRDIDVVVKKWLHLEPSTTDGILCSRNREGGHGLSRLATAIPAIQLQRLLSLYNSPDECTKVISRAVFPLNRIWQLWKKVWPEKVALGQKVRVGS